MHNHYWSLITMRKMWDTVKGTVKSGLSAHEMSLAVTAGVLGGIWPVPMTSFIGCLLLQAVFRLRPALGAIIQTINCIMTPVELALVSSFVYYGEYYLGAAEHFDTSSLVSALQVDLFGTLRSASGSLVYGILAWFAFVPIGGAVVYGLTYPIASRLLPVRTVPTQGVADKDV